jgi:hypothetical protein
VSELNTQTNSQNLILSQLTTRIQSDLSGWYGSQASLVGQPEVISRDWSVFFRYKVQVSTNEQKNILVKIRRTLGTGLETALVDEKIKQESIAEYASLVKIAEVFSSPSTISSFYVIRPLAYFDEINAIAQEEASIRSLRSFFQSPKLLLGNKLQRAQFESYMNLTGQWLRLFHDEVGAEQGNGDFFSEQLYNTMRNHLDVVKSSSSKYDVAFIQEYISSLFQELKGRTLPYRTLHNDFNSVNVFVSHDGRLCSFDPHNKLGPLYVDLAKIITDLETSRVQLLSGGVAVTPSQFQKFTAALLNGYFDGTHVDVSALTLFRVSLLLEKWAEGEVKLKKAQKSKKIFYFGGMIMMRFYVYRLLHSLCATKS